MRLFYDELAFHVSQNKMHAHFLRFVVQICTSKFSDFWYTEDADFEQAYDELVEDMPKSVAPLETRFEIRKPGKPRSDTATSIYLAVLRGFPHLHAPLEPGNEKVEFPHSVIFMCALFNLFTACAFSSCNEDVNVAAFLHYGLRLPAAEASEELDTEGKYVQITALYFAVDWMRQLLNAFPTSDGAVQRLKDLLALTAEFNAKREKLTGWSADDLFRDSLSQVKPLKTLTSFAFSQAAEDLTPALPKKEKKETKKARPSLVTSKAVAAHVVFRELHPDVLRLLLKAGEEEEDGTGLCFKDLEFLLLLLLEMAKFKLGGKTATKSEEGTDILSRIPTRVFMALLIDLAPAFIALLNKFSIAIDTLKDQNAPVEDGVKFEIDDNHLPIISGSEPYLS
jgi:hypothetical protein